MTLKVTKYTASTVFALACILAALDTHLFVYPSLSRYMSLELGLVCLAIIAIILLITKKVSITFQWHTIFIVVWISYIGIHYITTYPHELYRTLYLSVTLLAIPTLSICIRSNVISKVFIENSLLALGLIHILFIFAQFTGLANSGNVYFNATGADENPTVPALYLTGIVPLTISRIFKTKPKLAYITLLCTTIICIISLRCRTAYIGLLGELLVYAFISIRKRNKGFNIPWLFKTALTIFTVLLLFCAGIRMYHMKKDSADGRILIWKLSTELIMDKPLGHGYGLFEKYYNIKQAEYFSNKDFTQQERRNADYIYMPYNDYIEQGIEGGLIGMLFLVAFYGIGIWYAIKKNLPEEECVLASFAVMSLFNFVYTSIMPWMLVICYTSIIIAKNKEKNSQLGNKVIAIALPLFTILLTFFVVRAAMAQLKFTKPYNLINSGTPVDESYLTKIKGSITSSEAYWSAYATNSILHSMPLKAINEIHTARRYSSSPLLFYNEAKCLQATGDFKKSITKIDTLSCMLPHDLKLKFMLMTMEDEIDNKSKALEYAHDIIATGAKHENEENNYIIKRAYEYIISHE